MTEQETKDNPSWESFADFLANAPPSSNYTGKDIVRRSTTHKETYYLALPVLRMFCGAECQDVRYFENSSQPVIQRIFKEFVFYVCKHCNKDYCLFAVTGEYDPNGSDIAGEIAKIGQEPPFGPHTPAKLLRLIQEDRETFLQGRRAESLNLGVGAFAYYRRVVESQKDRLCDAIIKVAKQLECSHEVIDELTAAKANWQFKQGVEGIKDAIPDAFKIAGHNPLTLLHNALSEGVHVLSDDECLSRAQDARIVLTELAERLATLSHEQQQLKDAVGRLVKKKNSKS